MTSKALTDMSKGFPVASEYQTPETTTNMQTDFNSMFDDSQKTIMDSYKESRKQLTKASEASAGIIASEYGGAMGDAVHQGEQSLYSSREAGGGFATSPLALNLISEATDRRVRGLQKEKNELLMQNEYDKASALSQLIVDEQTAITTARVNALNEYFGFKQEGRAQAGEIRAQAGEGRAERTLSIAEQQAERDQLAFRTPEQQATMNLAATFPDADILPTDDFATAQDKAQASESFINNQTEGKLAIEQARANINQTYANTRLTNANITKALSDVTDIQGNEVTFVDTNGQEKTAAISGITKAIMDGTGSLKDLTPTDKATVLTEMSKIGYNPKQNLVGRMQGLLDLWDAVGEDKKGPVEGRLYSIGGYGASTDEAIAKFESARIPLTREIARLYDVGMLSDQDVADYKSAMPSLNDKSREAAAAKLGGLTTAMISSNQLTSPNKPKEGDTKEFEGRTYQVKNGTWVIIK